MLEPIVIDDFFPKNVLEKIDYFYKTASLKLSQTETDHTPTFLQCSIGVEELLGVFELDTHIEKHLNKMYENCTFKNLERFYINILTNAEKSKMVGHRDINESDLAEDDFYLISIIFLNPEGNKDTGIYINENYYEDVYNRMILFDGTNWHKPVTPQDNYVRITFYANFSNRISKHNAFKQLKNADACSKYFRNVYRK